MLTSATQVNRFFIYKEYGAKYEMMMKDVASANQAMPQWETFQKGLEALATILSSVKNAEERSRKALTIADLLVKVSCLGGDWSVGCARCSR